MERLVNILLAIWKIYQPHKRWAIKNRASIQSISVGRYPN